MAAERDDRREPAGETTGPSKDPDTPYSAGHTPSRGVPDENQGILENIREQWEKEEKQEPRPSAWHGDTAVPHADAPPKGESE